MRSVWVGLEFVNCDLSLGHKHTQCLRASDYFVTCQNTLTWYAVYFPHDGVHVDAYHIMMTCWHCLCSKIYVLSEICWTWTEPWSMNKWNRCIHISCYHLTADRESFRSYLSQFGLSRVTTCCLRVIHEILLCELLVRTALIQCS